VNICIFDYLLSLCFFRSLRFISPWRLRCCQRWSHSLTSQPWRRSQLMLSNTISLLLKLIIGRVLSFLVMRSVHITHRSIPFMFHILFSLFSAFIHISKAFLVCMFMNILWLLLLKNYFCLWRVYTLALICTEGIICISWSAFGCGNVFYWLCYFQLLELLHSIIPSDYNLI